MYSEAKPTPPIAAIKHQYSRLKESTTMKVRKNSSTVEAYMNIGLM